MEFFTQFMTAKEITEKLKVILKRDMQKRAAAAKA
jgi:hypothetical protein